MKILSLTQPWATLMDVGAKRIETRSWATKYRGWVAIHAAQGLGPVGGVEGLRLQCLEQHYIDVLTEHGYRVPLPERNFERTLPRGAIVAIADLNAILPTCAVTDTISEQERAFGNYASGRFAWHFPTIYRLREPLPFKGAQGLRELPWQTAHAAAIAAGRDPNNPHEEWDPPF